MALTDGTNLLLQALLRKDPGALLGQGDSVDLVLDHRLCDPGLDIKHVYFPVSGFISQVASIQGQPPLETGLIGNEGMLGATLALNVDGAPALALVHGAGVALRFTAAQFRLALDNHAGLRRIVDRYLFVLIAQQSRAVACTHFHDVESRLARMLLMIQDRTCGDLLLFTHGSLAQMLGVQRSAITIAAGRFQKEKLISYSRGEIAILDRQGLALASCECYSALSADYRHQFP